MAKKTTEKDVLIVRDEKTGEISVVAGLNALMHSILHRPCSACSVFRWRSDMESICGSTISHNLCQNVGTSFFGMLQFFQNHDPCSFSHYKASTVFIKWNGSPKRI